MIIIIVIIIIIIIIIINIIIYYLFLMLFFISVFLSFFNACKFSSCEHLEHLKKTSYNSFQKLNITQNIIKKISKYVYIDCFIPHLVLLSLLDLAT